MKGKKLKLIKLIAKIAFIFILGTKLLYSQGNSHQPTNQFTIDEIREIARLLNELEYRRQRDSIIQIENDILKRNIEVLENKNITLSEKNKNNNEREKLYQQQIEMIKPKWWDKFEYGLIGGLVINLIIIVLAQ